MNAKALFDGFDPSKHEAEVEERWGDTEAYRESRRRTKNYSKEDWVRIKGLDDALMKKLAVAVAAGAAPTDDASMELAEEHREHIDRFYYPCSHAMHENVAQMYTADASFQKNLDAHGQGVAALMCKESIARVASNLDLVMSGIDSRPTVAKSSLSGARDRLGAQPMKWLFEKTAAEWIAARARADEWRGLGLFGVDGTSVRVPDSEENSAAFGTQNAGEQGETAFPLVRAQRLWLCARTWSSRRASQVMALGS